MTTRQNLNRRFYRSLQAFAVIAVAVVVWDQTVSHTQVTDAVRVTFIFLSFGVTLAYRWQTPCAACRQSMGLMGLKWRPAQDANTSPKCPNCSVSIDRDPPT